MNTSLGRREFLAAAGIGGALVLLEPARGRRPAQALVKITHAEAVETLLYLPLYVAHAKGFFEEEGFEVTIYNAQQRTIAVRAVVAGDAFTYNGDPAEPALARQKGADIKNIGVIVNRAAVSILGKAGVPKDPKQWAGVTIIIPRPPHTSVSLTQMHLLNSGYKQADADGLVWTPSGGGKNIQLRPVVAGSELASLVAGQGDMTAVLEPQLSQGRAQGYPVVASFPELFGPFFFTSIATMASTIEKQPDLVQRYSNAMTKAMRWGHKNVDGAAEVAIKRYPNIDPKVVALAARGIVEEGSYPKDMRVTKDAYARNFDDLLVRTKHPAAKYPFDQLMDLRFAEKAAATVKV